MVVKSAAKIDHEVVRERKDAVLGKRPDVAGFISTAGGIDLSILRSLSYTSILSADQFDRDLLCELCKLAGYLQLSRVPIENVLHDKILAAAFFEPSTRTRLSFESAMLRLGGRTLSVADAASTGIAKGESLLDIGQMFNSYADLVVVRHPEQKALQDLSTYLRIPLINGGNGSDEHPTQALADWYALLKWKPELGFGTLESPEHVHLGIIGTPGNMRTVKSFLLLSLLFRDHVRKITIISELADPLGEDVQEFCDQSPVPIDVTFEIEAVLPELDVVYMNSIALLGDSYRKLGEVFKLDSRSNLKEGSVILHPLARNDELDTSLDDTPYNLYFNQADGAVFLREALLLCIFDRLDILPNSILKDG